jgi:hypothetical protein
MGLTIHYTLALPGKPSLVSVKSTIGALRQKCLDLPFQEVGELLDLDGDACDPEKQQDQSLRWFLIQAGVFTHFDFDSRGKPRKADQLNREVHTFKVPAARIIGFTTYPGPGCEMANVGLRLTPKTVKIPAIGDHDSGELKLSGGWGWSSFCKTQYASSSIEGGSLENFLRCHLAVVAMLDDARELGFETSVSDEGGFYDSRNLDALCKNLESYNEIVAGFAGMLKDAVANPQQLSSPILNSPEFERLEMKGRRRINPKFAEWIASIVRKGRSKNQS